MTLATTRFVHPFAQSLYRDRTIFDFAMGHPRVIFAVFRITARRRMRTAATGSRLGSVWQKTEKGTFCGT